MPLDIYTPMELYEIMFDPRQTITTSQWLDMFYPRSFLSTQEEIMFDKIDADRKIAPFMLPNAPGKPIFRGQGERIETFKPAYTKPKDAVRPTEALALQPGELTRRLALQSPEARYNAKVIEITQYHRRAIQRLWDYMAAKAVIDGAITINYYGDSGIVTHSVTIDFGRAAGHTITLGSGARWGDSGVKPWDNLQTWIDTVANAEFGGSVTDVMMGAEAAAAFLSDADVKDKLDIRYRGSEDVQVNRGLIVTDPMNPFTRLGTMGSGVNIWRVSGVGNTFQNANGTFTPILGSKQVLLASRAVNGVKAWGAILDSAANLQPADIFSKMWDEQDPSARFIMSQSAPLMIPVNPNCTLLANVLAP